MSNQYFKFSGRQLVFILLFVSSLPYASMQTYRWLDRLDIWERRILAKRRTKVAFDFMIKTLAEQERDVIEEFSDY